MAVASLVMGGKVVGLRDFHPPKRATLTAWYRAAAQGMVLAPEWRTVDMGAATTEDDTIHFTGDDWDLFIARKRNLKF